MTPRKFPDVDPGQALAAAHYLIRWTGEQNQSGVDLLTLCTTMVSTGANMAAGPDDPQEWRTEWANWLRGVADEIEAGRPIGQSGTA